MAYTTIDDPSAHFQATTYTGNNSDGLAITNSGNSNLQPDWLWIKKRSGSGQHVFVDSTRGTNKQLFSSLTDAEQTSTKFVASLDSDGFTLNDSSSGTGDTNTTNGGTYVAWQWKANGGTTSSNTDGGITSTVQANTEAGFSIVTYTGTGSATTVGHGLGIVPSWYVVKRRSATEGWTLYHHENTSAPETDHLLLESTSATTDQADIWNDTAPTSSVFSLGNNSAINASGSTYVAYCFSEVKGYSKFGSYIGNGNSDGTFVYTGFKPSWIMLKRTDSTNNWNIFDNKRDVDNQVGNVLYANLSDAEGADAAHSSANDFLSNGFKLRETGNAVNGNDAVYLYIAFAEHPFVSSKGVPTTAR